MIFTNIRGIIFFLLAVVLLIGCMKRTAMEPVGPEESWQRAQNLFERQKYFRAQQSLRDIVLNYPGCAMIDSVQFMLGRCSLEMADYLVATEEFQRLVDKYPTSKLVGDALFYSGKSLYLESPRFQLDQELTNKSLLQFQRFLEEHPAHALTDSGYFYLALCREKLARKEYAAAALYYDLSEYASAVLYADIILSNYYDTPLADPAQFLKCRSYFSLRDWEHAKKELQTYLDKYPEGKFSLRARQMLSQTEGRSGAAAAKTP